MRDLVIRPAVSADDSSLRALDVRTWSHLHAVTRRPEPTDPFFDAYHTPDTHLVAELTDGTLPGGDIAGYIRVVPPTPLPCNAHVRQIQGLAVDDRARGQGTARALIRAGLTYAGQQGARRVTLRVLGHNGPARRLYESEGFAVEGVLPGEFFLDGAYVDDVLMGRLI